MKSFLRSNTFKVLAVVLVVMGSVSILTNTVKEVSFANVLGFVSSPMQSTLTSLNNEDQSKLSQMSRSELEKYCKSLIDENERLLAKTLSYYDIKQENELYSQALNLMEQKPNLEIIPAMVIARDPSDIFYGMTIDVGLMDGVNEGDCIITSAGFVGVITSVSPTSSTVQSILSESFSIGAISKEYKETGVVSGDAELAINGRVKLEYLEKDTNVKKGAIISTSGNSGAYPEDIIIGTVSYMSSETQNELLYAVIDPYVDIENVTNVFVVKSFDSNYKVDLDSENTDTNSGDTDEE